MPKRTELSNFAGPRTISGEVLARGENVVDYLTERYDFLRMYAVAVENGGVDIALRIDGTYYGDLATGPEIEGQIHYERSRLLRAFSVSGIDPSGIEVGSRDWLQRKIAAFRSELLEPSTLDWSAGELVNSGECSGSCLVASTSIFECDCRCRGDWHGALANVVVAQPTSSGRDTP